MRQTYKWFEPHTTCSNDQSDKQTQTQTTTKLTNKQYETHTTIKLHGETIPMTILAGLL